MARKRKTPCRGKLFADFGQIHVEDESPSGDLADAWTVQATEDKVAAAGDIVGIGTLDSDLIPVELEVLSAAPAEDFDAWDHVTEAPVRLSSGTLVVAGCTDYRPDAPHFAVAAGDCRVRASHSGLANGRERIRLQVFPAPPLEEARVLARFVPPPPKSKKAPSKRSVKTAKQAAALARAGHPDDALAVLVPLAEAGDGAAAASAAEILAFRGRFAAMVPFATTLVANPTAVYAGNVFTDMCRLLRRAARELDDPSIVTAAAARVPAKMKAQRDAVLLREYVEPSLVDEPNRARFDEAVEKAETGKRFYGRPRELAAHIFALATVFRIDDEIVARWAPDDPLLHFDQAVSAARVLARRGDGERAWVVLASKLGDWWPVDHAQVAPVILVVDDWLSPLMTPEGCELVLTTPRGGEE